MKSLPFAYTFAVFGSLALLGASALVGRAGENVRPDVTPEQAKFFESKIRPLLADRCYSCHSGDAPKGGLRLDSWEGIAKGNASGPAVIPGDPEHSSMVKAIHYDGKIKMPPTGKLNESEIALLTDWIKNGAPWPAAKTTADTTGTVTYTLTPAQKAFWAFQPIRKPAPPKVANAAWVKNPIDAFVLSKLEAKGLTPAVPADRRTLIRRATYDVIGLPPTPQEIDAFLNDKSPNAWAKVVDRLLASPHYGERWGRHWLDVVRYADSNGQDENLAFANAWRYRDYVVNAFNKDKPYDQFMTEQLAGDLLPAADDDVRAEHLTATGFLVMGPKVLAEQDKPKMVMDIVDEQIEVTSKAFLGLTVACARCHNHKFDPIPTTDYYALAGIFKSTKTMKDLNFVSDWQEEPVPTKADKLKAEAAQQKLKSAEAFAAETKRTADEELRTKARLDAAKYLMAGWEMAQHQMRPLADVPAAPGEIRLMIEAETFARGNVLRDTDNYGQGIGVIHTGDAPTNAEWDITVPAAGEYQFDLRYAAEMSRPLTLILNGAKIRSDIAGSATGGWYPDKQKWEPQAILTFKAGKNVLRLECNGAIPHIDKLLLVSTKSDGKTMLSPAAIAAKYQVQPEMAAVWANTLRMAAHDPVLGAWTAFGNLPKENFAAQSDTLAAQIAAGKGPNFTPAPAVAHAFAGFHPHSLSDVADKYAALFRAIDSAWSEVKKSQPNLDKLPDANLETIRQTLTDSKGLGAVPENALALYAPTTKKNIEQADSAVKMAKADAEKAAAPVAMAVRDDKPQNVRVHIRGNTLTLGEEVPHRFLTVLAGEKQTPLGLEHSGRLELAHWLASANNPLPSRVAVNRIWQEHFGAGLIRTPENFGLLGERPSNPPLMDWLAATFREQNWSMKKMHRLMLLSATYQMSDAPNAKAALADPDNRLQWHFNRRRLEAEPFRDGILAAAGTLDTTMGGSLLDTPDYGYVTNDQSGNLAGYTTNRRSIYLPIIRNALYDMFQAFDMGDPGSVNAKRATTTVAPQALWAMNSPFVLEQARRWAADLLADKNADDSARVRTIYLRAFSRPVTAAETTRARAFIAKMTAKLENSEKDANKRQARAWESLCQIIFASNEFIYLD